VRAALEESLPLAREQLPAANCRAETLEASLRDRDNRRARLHAHIEALETGVTALRGKHEAAEAAHAADRGRAEARHEAARARWMAEVDRAREILLKALTKEYERHAKALRGELAQSQSERDDIHQALLQARAELNTTNAMREQPEQRLRASAKPLTSRARAGPPRPAGKRTRGVRASR
jgi:hypothetical protein